MFLLFNRGAFIRGCPWPTAPTASHLHALPVNILPPSLPPFFLFISLGFMFAFLCFSFLHDSSISRLFFSFFTFLFPVIAYSSFLLYLSLQHKNILYSILYAFHSFLNISNILNLLLKILYSFTHQLISFPSLSLLPSFTLFFPRLYAFKFSDITTITDGQTQPIELWTLPALVPQVRTYIFSFF